MGKSRAYFGAIPFRALADRGLSETDVRVLGIIAAHDSMSLLRGGDGCWAGTDRIAGLANINASNTSTSITKLERLGYLRRGRHPLDGRRSTFRVVYDASADKAAFKGDVLPEGKVLQMKQRAGLSPDRGKLSCPEIAEARTDAGIRASNIKEDTLKIPSGESAPTPNVGAMLARLERRIHCDRVPLHERSVWIEFLQGVVDDNEFGDPNRGRAERLMEELAA